MMHNRRSVLGVGAAAAVVGGASVLDIGHRPARSVPGVQRTELTAAAMITPSADSTGATDTNAIQTAMNASPTVPVVLASGVYYLNAPLQMVAGNSLIGSGGACMGGPATTGTGATDSIGTVLTFGSAWQTPKLAIGSPGVITMSAPAPSSTIKAQFRMNVSDLWIDGTIGASKAPSGVDGISAIGPQSAVSVSNVGIFHVNGNGFAGYQTGTTTEIAPDGWAIYDCLVQQCDQAGIAGIFADTNFVNVRVQQSGSHGFVVQRPSRLFGCQSDLNGGDGYQVTALNEGNFLDGVTLMGCGSQRNSQHGLEVVITNPNSSNLAKRPAPVTVTGCTFDGDGRNYDATTGKNLGGGNYAGIRVAGPGTVVLAGSNVLVHYEDVPAPGCPQYGLVTDSTSTPTATYVPALVLLSNCFLNCADSSGFYHQFATAAVLEFSNAYGQYGGQWTGTGSIRVT
jgi:hypothetical protein